MIRKISIVLPQYWAPQYSEYCSTIIRDDNSKQVPLHSIIASSAKWVNDLELQLDKVQIKVQNLCSSQRSCLETQDSLGEYTNTLNEIEMHVGNTVDHLNNVTIKTATDKKNLEIRNELEELKSNVAISLSDLDKFRSKS